VRGEAVRRRIPSSTRQTKCISLGLRSEISIQTLKIRLPFSSVLRLHSRLMEEKSRARKLRQSMPDAQRRLWRLLRDRRFAGYKFRREHPVGPYTLDFYCAEAGVSIEVDGRQHGHPDQQAHDREKENYLLGRGIITIRFWNWQIRQQPEVVRQTLWQLLQQRLPHPGNAPVDPRARSRNWPPRPASAKPSLRPNRLPPKV